MYKVGVIGCGYWGPNLVRNFVLGNSTEVVRVADKVKARVDAICKIFPAIHGVTDAEAIFADPAIDLVAIATPVSSHYPLARRALEEGKHVLIEKPLTANSAQAEELCLLAEARGLLLMVDHTFLFTGAVRKLKELIDSGELGDIQYLDSTRINLGLHQEDVSVIWDIGPHDLSIIQYLLGRDPESVAAVASCHVSRNPTIYDHAYMTLRYGKSTMAHVTMSWLSPVKVRQTIIGGSKKMAIYNDLENVSKLQVFDCGAKNVQDMDIQKVLVQYRRGDMYAPMLDTTEALRAEVAYIVHCLDKGERAPINSGRKALAIVRAIEVAEAAAADAGAFRPVPTN